MKLFSTLLLSLFISSCTGISFKDIPDIKVCVRQFDGAACTKVKSQDYFEKIEEEEYLNSELGAFVIYPEEYAKLTLFFRELCAKDKECSVYDVDKRMQEIANPKPKRKRCLDRVTRRWTTCT